MKIVIILSTMATQSAARIGGLIVAGGASLSTYQPELGIIVIVSGIYFSGVSANQIYNFQNYLLETLEIE